MTRKIEVRQHNNNYTLSVDYYPSTCGLCHANVDPTFISASFVKATPNRKEYLESVFQCTNINCNSLIIGYYRSDTVHDTRYKYQKNEPIKPKDKSFQEEIGEVSENFVRIYNQALHAEQIGLDLISGIGYRKALEFLIKDYLIYLIPENEEETLRKQLSPCINMLDNQNIKEMAKRAAWLGNDEAHYIRKWEDKDINDLKKLIEVTVYYIAMEVTSEKYLEEMI